MNEQQNIQSETLIENKTTIDNLNEPPKPKKSPTAGIIIALLVLVIICLVGYISYDNGYLDKLIKKEEIPAGKPTPENVEKEITDNSVITKLNKQQSILNLIGASSISPAPSFYGDNTNTSLSEGKKIYAVIRYLDTVEKKTIIDEPSKYPNITGADTDPFGHTLEEIDMTATEYYTSDMDDKFHIIKGSDVREVYKSIFGTEPTGVKVENQYPWYYYEKAYDIYLEVSKGGGTCGIDYAQHNYKYTEDNNYAYIYTANVYYSCEEYVYKDLEGKEKLLQKSEGQEINEKTVEDNLSKLHKYRIAFKKDNGNYIFDKVEEVK